MTCWIHLSQVCSILEWFFLGLSSGFLFHYSIGVRFGDWKAAMFHFGSSSKSQWNGGCSSNRRSSTLRFCNSFWCTNDKLQESVSRSWPVRIFYLSYFMHMFVPPKKRKKIFLFSKLDRLFYIVFLFWVGGLGWVALVRLRKQVGDVEEKRSEIHGVEESIKNLKEKIEEIRSFLSRAETEWRKEQTLLQDLHVCRSLLLDFPNCIFSFLFRF